MISGWINVLMSEQINGVVRSIVGGINRKVNELMDGLMDVIVSFRVYALNIVHYINV